MAARFWSSREHAVSSRSLSNNNTSGTTFGPSFRRPFSFPASFGEKSAREPTPIEPVSPSLRLMTGSGGRFLRVAIRRTVQEKVHAIDYERIFDDEPRLAHGARRG